MNYSTALLGLLAATAARAADPAQIDMGRGVAERHCGGCHATGTGQSRLADAPPFRELYRRYGAGGLPALLAEGMLTPDPSPEEGVAQGHPRMPTLTLGVDERSALKAYLESLEPWRNATGASGGFDRDQGAALTIDHSGGRRTVP